MEQAVYSQVYKYIIRAECQQPLHVGSAMGSQYDAEVLTHPIDDRPFIQATSLAGVFRDYYTQVCGKDSAQELFGKAVGDENESSKSKIQFTDGIFDKDTIQIELRSRIKINNETGTVQNNVTKESEKNSGQKFEMEYIGAGAKLEFTVYLYDVRKEFEKQFYECLAGIQSGNIQVGGQKSNGCGCLKLNQVLYKKFNLKKDTDRNQWFDEDDLKNDEYEMLDLKKDLPKPEKKDAYDIHVSAKTDGELLIKAMAVLSEDSEADTPDAKNMQNAEKEYIIPATSLKGALRNRMELIASYKNIDKKIIDQIFGKASSDVEEGNVGNICFYDTVVGKKEENDANKLRIRIHIDKFTGGVMNGALFSEQCVAGDVEFHIRILDREKQEQTAKQTCALVALALRDMANGQVTLGSGYSIGRGFFDVQKIKITDRNSKTCSIDFKQKSIQDQNEILSSCLAELKAEEEINV